ncbi:hypothetical protein [Nitrosophilus labii]|uniref:hypothetical protein n=1 Tax=Nitrosophilus labii TaxID=2706014 RepID=UPI001657319D|nr:hypothetical protein [Nitrosophilus labii]
MKRFYIFLLFTQFLFACSGDCIACHPVLKKSIDKSYHKVLKRCIECHKDYTGPNTECGKDCFECHSKKKLIDSKIPEHRAIKNCSKCHVEKELLKESIFEKSYLYEVFSK